jgi:hypothetical protein
MEIADYEFKGPFTDMTKLPLDVSAVYVVACHEDGEPRQCLDIGETPQLGERLRSHDRRPCWEDNCDGDIAYYYRRVSGTWDRDLEPNPLETTSAEARSERLGIVSELQWRLDPVCGSNPWQTISDHWETYQQYETTFGEQGSETLAE